MSFEKSKCSFIKKEKLKEEQVMLDSVVNGVSSENGKILWLNAQPQIEMVEPLTKEATVSGKVFAEVVFKTENGDIEVVETTMPFLTKILGENIQSTSKLNVCVEIVELKFEPSNSKICLILSLKTELINFVEMEILNGGDENICIKEDELICQNLVKSDCTTFNQEQEVTIGENFDKILGVYSEVFVKDTQNGNNFFTIQGEIITKIFYKNTDEVAKIGCEIVTETFKREIEAGGITDNAKIEATAIIKKENITYSREETEGETLSNKLNLILPITVCYCAIEEISVPCAIDLFSLKNNLEIVTSSYQKTKICPLICFDAKVEGTGNIGEDAPRIDKFLGTSKGYLQTTKAEVVGGEIVIEGILHFDVIYLNDESQEILNSHNEIPFTIKEPTKANSEFQVISNITLCDLDVVARRGRELSVDAKIKASVKLFKLETGAIITDAVMGEPLPPKEEAIEIYFGKKGDSVWQIAKDLKTQIEIIFAQNPALLPILEENQNIVIYHQKGEKTGVQGLRIGSGFSELN